MRCERGGEEAVSNAWDAVERSFRGFSRVSVDRVWGPLGYRNEAVMVPVLLLHVWSAVVSVAATHRQSMCYIGSKGSSCYER